MLERPPVSAASFSGAALESVPGLLQLAALHFREDIEFSLCNSAIASPFFSVPNPLPALPPPSPQVPCSGLR
jgi:hypothetical protein